MKNKVNKEKQRTLKVLLFSVLAVVAVALVLFLPSCSISTDKLNDALKEYEDNLPLTQATSPTLVTGMHQLASCRFFMRKLGLT